MLLAQAVQLLGEFEQKEQAVELQISKHAVFTPIGTTWYSGMHEMQLTPRQAVQFTGHAAGQNPAASAKTDVLVHAEQLLALPKQPLQAVALQGEQI